MNNNNSFQALLAQGKKMESVIQCLLQSNNFEVKDVSDIIEWQKQDVDFLINKYGSEKIVKLEVKSDKVMWKSGNCFIEDYQERSTGRRDGFLHYCNADVLSYVDEHSKIAYMINWQELKKIIHKFPNRRFFNYADNCYGSGILVPISYILDNNLCFKVYDMKDEVA